METASLRLKFTPIIKDILHNNSNCCLEIVPEVSSVQNIDKLEWKQNCDCIEYTIPITYKIILKKKKSETMDTIDWGKTYHSCVDLLSSSSLSNIIYASGDVKRIISDTFILNRMTSYYEEDIERKKKIHQQKLKAINDQDEIVIINTEKDETCLFIDPPVAPDGLLDNIEECVEETNDSKNDELSNDNTTQETPSEYDTNKKPSYKDIGIEITESLDNISLETSRSKENSKRQLSITPICSINTNDKPLTDTIDAFSLNSVICRMFGSENLHSHKYIVNRQEHVVDEKVLYKPLVLERVQSLKDISVTSFYTTNREGPEERVAEFVKKMEAEVFPLKVMLNDILEKCATLGLLKNKLITSMEFDQANSSRLVEKQSKSNRVVYTIVFDG